MQSIPIFWPKRKQPKDNHEATVEVVKKEYIAADEVPLPMEKTKHIIRKCTKDDFDL